MLKTGKINANLSCMLGAILILITCGQSIAQEVQNPKADISHSLYKGSKALQFRITNDFVLDDFQGAALSAKKHISKNSAIRLGINLFFDFSTEDSDTRMYANDTTITTSDTEINAQRLMLELQYLKYMSTERRIKFFWCAGPTVHLNREIEETDYFDSRIDDPRELKYENKSWGLGGLGVLGVEWFATRDISFHTEYMLTILYEWRKFRNDNYTGTDFNTISYEERGIQVYASNVRFGLSLYF